MSRSFGEGYISNVKGQQVEGWGDLPVNLGTRNVITVAGDVALQKLQNILLILDGILFLTIPPIAYFIAGKTLSPIEESYTRQKRFVSDASHELRTPLTVLRGELDLALKKERTPKEYQQALETAQSEVIRLNLLTDSLLTIAKAEQTSQKFISQKIDAIDLVAEVLSSYEMLINDKKISFDFTPPEKAIYFLGDETGIRQLVTNLVENAVKFTPENGNITILLDDVDKYLQFEIIDSGPGMTDKEIKKALEPFYQVDTSRNEQGFGLGLSICKTIVKRHKGTIRLALHKPTGLHVIVKLPN